MFQDWTDAEWAKTWSDDPLSRNPTRPEQLDILLTLIADAYTPGRTIVDLGSGSGLVEALLFERIPHARVIGVDRSDAMMALAAKRLERWGGQFVTVKHDLTMLETLELSADAQIIFSVQALHHLTHEQTPTAYAAIHRLLVPDGLFFLLDRIRLDSRSLFPQYQSLWRRADRLFNAEWESLEGDTYESHHASVTGRGDYPGTLEQHLQWMREAGFESSCLHLHATRALLVARKV